MFRIVYHNNVTRVVATIYWCSMVASGVSLADELNRLQSNGYTIFSVLPEDSGSKGTY